MDSLREIKDEKEKEKEKEKEERVIVNIILKKSLMK